MSEYDILVSIGLIFGLSLIFTVFSSDKVNAYQFIFYLSVFIGFFVWSGVINKSYLIICLIAQFIIFYIKMKQKGV